MLWEPGLMNRGTTRIVRGRSIRALFLSLVLLVAAPAFALDMTGVWLRLDLL